MHLALFYRGNGEYLDGVMSFIEPALAAGEPVAAAVPPTRGTELRELRAGRGDQIEILDMFELGRNPARIIPAVQMMLAKHDGELLHYVGEPIWPGRSAEEIREATKHEALINLAWPGARIRVLCPYDAAALDQAVLDDAERTHPRVIRDGRELESAAYHGPRCRPVATNSCSPRRATRRAALRPREPVRHPNAGVRAGQSGGLDADARPPISCSRSTSLPPTRSGTAMAAALCTSGRVPGEVVCQVQDSGRIDDPLAGRRVPAHDGAAESDCGPSTSYATWSRSARAAAARRSVSTRASTEGSRPNASASSS